MTRIVLNGQEIEVDPKQPLIRACHDHGVDVPMYCYHPGLSPVGSCRICQVQVKVGETPARVVVACRTPVSEGMVVDTQAPKAHEARRECLEFLLKNHPLDCPICDKAGECDLQDYAFMEGQGEGRSSEPRRQLDKRKSLGDVIVLDEERCILCSRCVRFFEEVPKTPQLTVSGLGSRSVISTFLDRPLTGNYQGNIADVCPVGALTLKSFRFRARVWNLEKTISTCAECSRGCAITVEVLRRREVKRFRPRHDAAVNGWWMCDTGRFAFGHVTMPLLEKGAVLGGRLTTAAVRNWGGLEAAEVDEALARAADMLAATAKERRAVVLSPFVTVEEAREALALAARLGAEAFFVSPRPSGLADDLLNTGDPCPNRHGLVQLGLQGLEAEAAIERLKGLEAVVAVGERVLELLEPERVGTLPATLRLMAFDLAAIEAPALDVLVPVPTHVEKAGYWLNVDGIRRDLAIAKAPPAGVPLLTRSLERLAVLLAAGGEVQA